MTDKSIFFDTPFFIYALEKGDQKARHLFEKYLPTHRLCTSVITLMEYAVDCRKSDCMESWEMFLNFLTDMSFEVIEIDADIAFRAASIRAEHSAFKGMDALQLAAALSREAEVFCTNDRKLLSFSDKGMQVELLSEES